MISFVRKFQVNTFVILKYFVNVFVRDRYLIKHKVLICKLFFFLLLLLLRFQASCNPSSCYELNKFILLVIVLRTNPSNQYDDDVRDHFTFRYIFFYFQLSQGQLIVIGKKMFPLRIEEI